MMNTRNVAPPPYYLPRKIARGVEAQIKQCKNPSLILNKYVPREVIDNTKTKESWLRKFGSEYIPDFELVKNAYKRWQSMLKAYSAMHFNATLDWRMVVGLGGKSVLKTDMTLHPLYGIPYIPGSALKGLTRAFASTKQEYYVPLDKPEAERKPSLKEENDHPAILRIFGTQKKAGTVIFFDAMPVDGQCLFVVDIMNPHYPNYYNSLQSTTIQAPTNDQSPNPIPFLTVQDATFTFALAVCDPEHQEDVNIVQALLLEALQQYGVGGKTSAGYGYFEDAITTAESSQAPDALKQAAQPHAPSGQTERIRARLPQFREGQEIRGAVVPLTEELRQKISPDIKAVLRYESFSTSEAVMAVSEEDAQNWKSGETRMCVFVREEAQNDLIIWICEPRVKKGKDKKK